MKSKDKNIVLDLCKGQSQEIQNLIKVAYWHGCSDGIVAAKNPKNRVIRREDNVLYLKDTFLMLGKPKKLR